MKAVGEQGATSLLSRCDARVKLVVLIAFSASVFFVDAWPALAAAALAVGASLVAADARGRAAASVAASVGALMAIVWAAGSFTPDVADAALEWAQGYWIGPGDSAHAGVALSGWDYVGSAPGAPVAIAGSFGFVPEASARLARYAARIELVALAGLAVYASTSESQLTAAFAALLAPLRVLRAPVDDMACALALAVRAIPMVAGNARRIQAAQRARCARFDEGGPIVRLRAWLSVLTPLVVGMYRQGERLASSMDARCYGAYRRTSLAARRLRASEALAAAALIVLCSFAALVF